MKPKTHEIITQKAIEFCRQEKVLSNRLYFFRKTIIKGSSAEDTSALFQRATNWHFYRASNSPIPKKVKLIFKPTSEKIFDKRVNKMDWYDGDDFDFYKYFGRVLHHIQDMSTPSHVLPIYHGPKVPFQMEKGMIDDHFEEFMDKNSDKISFDNILQIPSIKNITSLKQIYDESAKDMLENILKVNDDIENRPFRNYWKHHSEKECEKIKGFGVYGEDHEKFIDNTPEDQEKLLIIQDIITTHAIQNTCKALLFLDERLTTKTII